MTKTILKPLTVLIFLVLFLFSLLGGKKPSL